MVFLVGGANSAAGYNIENSCRFNDDDDAYLTVTGSSTTSSGKTSTLSVWVKRSKLGAEQYILHARSADSQGNFARLEFSGDDTLRLRGYSTTYLETDAEYIDPSAWYHIVLAIDTDTSGDGNSCRLYVNGSEVTSFSTDTNPSTDEDLVLGSDRAHYVGASFYGGSAGAEFDGYMAELHFIDGQQLTHSSFGETDSGIWKPKQYSGSYGGNGFYLEFKASGVGTAGASTIGADTSGNTNHLTSSGIAVVDQCTDSPTNNFATMNPIDISSPSGAEALPTFSEGNCKLTRGNEASARSTIGLPESGKWYFEVKYLDGFTNGYPQIYLTVNNTGDGQGVGFHTPDGSNYRGKNGAAGTVNNAFDGSPANDDILGFYVNMDDKILIVHQNGSDFMGSGAASGIDFSSTTFATYTSGFFFVGYNSNASSSHSEEFNFGNPPFAISSGNADARGYGNFEFDPTLGGVEYYAICTKNLAVS